MKKQLRVGMVGYKMMGRAHSNAYRALPFFFDHDISLVTEAIVGRDEAKTAEAARKLGWNSYETDWRKLIERDDIDIIDIVTPNDTHEEIAIAAAEAGKHVICEKPLSLTLQQSKRMLTAVENYEVMHMICHNYRFSPAVQFAKKLISENRLGKIYHMRATFIQDWLMDPEFPLVWRLQQNASGSGTLGDLGSHILDLARFLVGEFEEVIGMTETFIKRRPLGGMGAMLQPERSQTKEYGDVTVDDAAAFLARFENGAMGNFEVSRFARGNRAGNRFEINGENGSIRWDMENLNNLQVYLEEDEPGLQGFRTINCTEMEHPYASAYWGAGHILGYEHTFIHLLDEFVRAFETKNNPSPDFEDGVKNQAVLEAVERSIETRTWSNFTDILQSI
ncbi:putative dehydrogenase [Geomicrobium halophilum]|uniref:Putative dehydrogenase n=1 Tax=Geomicrobium halophilum TaxID=549000 RepID=A0A841PWP4_9BACL|nr:Gfo/Idh/MocA family oxidoreductase [Geomicrobium halophilum]MBB6448763.1 putative dehydrogenase [Geomicrobium halophilum]